MRTFVGVFSLALCLLAGVCPANATIYTIRISGDLTSGFETDNYFGLGANTDLTGDSAVFTYVINTSLLGTPQQSSPGSATWVYSDVPTFAGDSPQCPPCSSSPIGITDSVTINGVTLTTGLDRQLLYLEYGDPSAPGENVFEVTSDNKNEPEDLASLRDYVTLIIITESDNTFFPSLDPNNIGDLSFPTCNTDNGDSSIAEFRTDAAQDGGNLNLCTATVNVSISSVPEPTGLALFGAGLLGLVGLGSLAAFGRRKSMTG